MANQKNANKRIAFLLRDDAIVFYLKVARELESRGIEVFWITINQGWFDYLKKHVARDRLFFLPTPILDPVTEKPNCNLIDELEKQFADFNISKWIFSDRGLIGRNYEQSLQMLCSFAERLKNVLVDQQISHLLGEMTFAYELVAYYVCRYLNKKYLYPDTAKIPSDRFAFFETPYYGDEFLVRPADETALHEAQKFYRSWRENKVKPHFFYLHQFKPLPKTSWLSKFNRWTGETDYISSDTKALAQDKIKSLVNYFYLKFVRFYRLDELPQEYNYVIYPLHKQPEATADITAPEFSNQLATIENIARSLPRNYMLLVKEHSNAFGCRGREFFKKIQNMKNVFLLGPHEDNYAVLEKCDMVFTIAGTMGYEAALLGKPVVVFSNIFYKDLKNVHYCQTAAQLTALIKENLKTNSFSEDDSIQFIARLIANTYPGKKGNPNVHKTMMQSEHIRMWGEAFEDYLNA